MNNPSLLLPASILALTVLCPFAAAQVPPGHYLVSDQLTVGTVKTGEMWTVDPSTRTATQLQWNSTIVPNAIHMISPAVGYVSSLLPTSEIYRITVAGTKVTETKINSAAIAGGNICQLVLMGSTFYFTTNPVAPATVNELWTMPLGGGAPVKVWDDSKLTPSLPTGQLVNALAGDPSTGKVYLCYWTSGIVVEYDTKAQTAKQIATLTGKVNAAILPCNAQIDAKGNLVAASIYGDIVTLDVQTLMAVQHLEPRTAGGAAPWTTTKNAICYNPDTGDWVFSTRDACVEPVGTVGLRAIARRMTVLIKPPYSTTTNNPNGRSTTGIVYMPSGGTTSSYLAYGAGCSNTAAGDFVPASGAGIITKASKSFSFTVDGLPANSVAVLILGVNKINVSLGGGCSLFTTPIVVLSAVATPSDPALMDNGTYRAQIGPLALPASNQKFNTQWAAAWATTSNLNLIMSEARTLIVQ